ncbi:Spx/MgsR family RNA polymerase-binding regulatory protein [Aquibacillus kalidii]|uniref:Spx/MgsR family RNA polymerase-binding regulatory protein n=1 Tax=Aquibacillus kalidii TaxID=2762597 RepID=UPI00164592E7|nr:Spx/MgsR family RNA polymerase-binding regulatory protein [Aquibacillus kalidii]
MCVKIFGVESSSMKKARLWFERNEILFVERNIIKKPLSVCELQDILRLADEGTEGIVSSRSKIYKEVSRSLYDDLDELPLHTFLELIHKHPRLLKSPIIVDDKRIQVGYSETDIRKFIPKKSRLKWRMKHIGQLEVKHSKI